MGFNEMPVEILLQVALNFEPSPPPQRPESSAMGLILSSDPDGGQRTLGRLAIVSKRLNVAVTPILYRSVVAYSVLPMKSFLLFLRTLLETGPDRYRPLIRRLIIGHTVIKYGGNRRGIPARMFEKIYQDIWDVPVRIFEKLDRERIEAIPGTDHIRWLAEVDDPQYVTGPPTGPAGEPFGNHPKGLVLTGWDIIQAVLHLTPCLQHLVFGADRQIRPPLRTWEGFLEHVAERVRTIQAPSGLLPYLQDIDLYIFAMQPSLLDSLLHLAYGPEDAPNYPANASRGSHGIRRLSIFQTLYFGPRISAGILSLRRLELLSKVELWISHDDYRPLDEWADFLMAECCQPRLRTLRLFFRGDDTPYVFQHKANMDAARGVLSAVAPTLEVLEMRSTFTTSAFYLTEANVMDTEEDYWLDVLPKLKKLRELDVNSHFLFRVPGLVRGRDLGPCLPPNVERLRIREMWDVDVYGGLAEEVATAIPEPRSTVVEAPGLRIDLGMVNDDIRWMLTELASRRGGGDVVPRLRRVDFYSAHLAQHRFVVTRREENGPRPALKQLCVEVGTIPLVLLRSSGTEDSPDINFYRVRNGEFAWAVRKKEESNIQIFIHDPPLKIEDSGEVFSLK